MLRDDVLYLSVRELGNRIRRKDISPVELTESYLARSRSLGPRLNAYATPTPELAMEQARAAEAEIQKGKYRGQLHGIPYAAKDLLAVKGYPTGWGAKPYADQRFDFNATVIERLHAAGAILLGKAAMIELAGGMGYRYASASVSGPAKNPWNEDCWTCGSSSGSGAIASAALAAFAIGTETWGSIVCPASFCGVSGLRPTYGRVSRHGAMALTYSMDKIGPITRSAEDCGLVLAAIAGHDPADPASLPKGTAEFAFPQTTATDAAAKGPLRIGWLEQKMIAPGGDRVMKAARGVIEKMGQVREATLPPGPWEAAAGVVLTVEGASAFSELIESGRVAELTDPTSKLGGYVNTTISGSDYHRAQRIRLVLQQKMAGMFEEYDVLATAGQPVTSTHLNENIEQALNYPDPIGGIGNFCGLPAVCVPAGFADNKLPLAVQFVAAPLAEKAALRAALEFQAQTEWHRQRPPIS